MFPRARVQGPYLVSGGTVLAIGLGVMVFLAIWVTRQSGQVRRDGAVACLAAGHTEAECEEGADENHTHCMNLTFQRGSKRSPGDKFDQAGYVACILDGPEAFRQAEYEKRKAERAAGSNSSALR